MKKYILFSFVFVFGFFNINVNFTNAQEVVRVPGCTTTSAFSITTGESCGVVANSTSGYLPGCTATTKFSITTGKACGNVVASVDTSTVETKIIKLLDSLFVKNLTVGAKGQDVKMLQQVLKDTGFLSGIVDGNFGPITKRSVTEYQKDSKLAATGIADTNTYNKIKSIPIYNLCKFVNNISSVRYVCPLMGTNLITVLAPAKNSLVSSPLKISGYMAGGDSGWTAIEGHAGTVKLVDTNGKELATGFILSKDSKTTSFDFSAILTFTTPTTASGNLVFTNENPSGLATKKKEFILPVQFIGSTTEAGISGMQLFSKNSVISGVFGPQSLAVSEQGTWTITSADSSGESLSYKVNWGDATSQATSEGDTVTIPGVQSTTITHSYGLPGIFTPIFTIINKGKSSIISLGVNVGGVPSSVIISGASAPQTLNIGQEGSWTITAFDSSVGGGALSYKVDWGDVCTPSPCVVAPVQTSSVFTHIYPQGGTYTPIFTVTNSNGRNAKITLVVDVSGVMITNVDPVIHPIVLPSNIKTGISSPFVFSATDADNNDLSWSIDWGDGDNMLATCPVNPVAGSGKNFSYNSSHIWANPGNYILRVAAYDCKGGSDETMAAVSVTGAASSNTVITEAIGPQILTVGEIGTWTITASSDAGGSLSYKVNWGEAPTLGAIASQTVLMPASKSAVITHIYAVSGIYEPLFTVINSTGDSAETSLSVNVGDAAPVIMRPILGPVTVIYNVQKGVVTPFTFSSRNVENNDLTWSINWGDGFAPSGTAVCPPNPPTGTGQNTTYDTSYTWSNVGEYSATATVSDCTGGTAGSLFTVKVN